MTPELALSGWKSSPAHNNVILNRDVWTQPWGAMEGNQVARFLEGSNKCLEGNQYPAGSLGGASFMDNGQNVSGQFWKLTFIGGHGYMQMTTMFREPLQECFEANPNAREPQRPMRSGRPSQDVIEAKCPSPKRSTNCNC